MNKFAKTNINKITIAVFINILLLGLLIFSISSIIRTFYLAIIISCSLSVIINILLIIFSNTILLKLNDAKLLPITYSNRIEKLVNDLSIKFGITKPQIKLINEKNINSISIGLNSNKSYILLTKGAFDNLNNDELEYILSYEMLKISKRETSLNTVLIVTLGLIIILSDIFFRSIFKAIQKRGKESESFMRLLLTTLFLFFAPLSMFIVELFNSKNSDTLNDILYLDISNKPLQMISTLNKMQEINKLNNMYSRACTNMFFVNPLIGQKVSRKFSYHTSINKRIENIKSK